MNYPPGQRIVALFPSIDTNDAQLLAAHSFYSVAQNSYTTTPSSWAASRDTALQRSYQIFETGPSLLEDGSYFKRKSLDHNHQSEKDQISMTGLK